MHYRNGREAKNGDLCVKLGGGGSYNGVQQPVRIEAVGILYEATAGNNYCNGKIAPTLGGLLLPACICDMLHMDDVDAIIREKGLDVRPKGM